MSEQDSNYLLGFVIVIAVIFLLCSCSKSDNQTPRQITVVRSMDPQSMDSDMQEPYFYDPTGSGPQYETDSLSAVQTEKARHDDSLMGGGFMGIRHTNTPHPIDNFDGEYKLLKYSYDGHVEKQIPRNMPTKFKMLDNDGLIYGEIQPRRSDQLTGFHGFPFERDNNASLFKGVV